MYHLVIRPASKELFYHGDSESTAKNVLNGHKDVYLLTAKDREDAVSLLKVYNMSLPNPEPKKNPINEFVEHLFGEEKVEIETNDFTQYGKVVYEELTREANKIVADYAEPIGNFLIKLGKAIKRKPSE